jgi:hypothetical protein
VEDSGDQDVPAVSIVDDVAFDCERANAFAELRPEATDPRLIGQQFEPLDDRVNESIGSRGAGILGDVGSDLLEVLLSKSGQPIGHLRLLGASRTTARLDPLRELSTRGPVVRTSLAPSQLIKARLHVGTKLLPCLVAFLQKPERLTDNFAGGLVQTALDTFLHESFELWRQRDVHADLAPIPRLDVIANIVNI